MGETKAVGGLIILVDDFGVISVDPANGVLPDIVFGDIIWTLVLDGCCLKLLILVFES